MFTGATLATSALAEEPPAADEAAAPEALRTGEAIIVTATRRNTTLMDTPINISALGGETLEDQRIDDVRDLAAFTPGMTISDTGPARPGRSCCEASAHPTWATAV